MRRLGPVFAAALAACAPGATVSQPAAPPSAPATVLAQAAPAPARAAPATQAALVASYAEVVRRAAPAVVNIYTRRTVRTAPPLLADPFFRRFFGLDDGPFAPREQVQTSLGSGVIVDPSGVIVTNDHVIGEADEITVVLADRREFPARILGRDPRTDLAVLRIEVAGERLPALAFRDSDEVEVGDVVLAIGNPFGVGQTVTQGIVSALARTGVGITDYKFFIQTDAAINPGNSGGALVTTDGRLIGINTAIFSRTGGSIGIGFAIPSNMVRRVVAGFTGAGLARPWIGARMESVTAEIAQAVGLPRPLGAIVSEVAPNSPGARAGLRRGDVIVSFDGRPVEDAEALRFRLATREPRGSARLGVFRQGREVVLTLPLEAPPETPPRNATLIRGNHALAGAVVGNLSPALADELGLGLLDTGVVVIEVREGSPAARVGFRPGDVILRVAGREVRDVASLLAALQNRAAGPMRVAIRREGRVLEATLAG
ncbi:DegQ family serine endoprotease [Elioraea thermophila]|uniref:DegQ family serine endoprotease n=1 Tax=Elioraea thermophila TaxID=2185104 RepID=UPI000DF45E83|nr:DegQ family serine endoprotease [Elioraea thermophila]